MKLLLVTVLLIELAGVLGVATMYHIDRREHLAAMRAHRQSPSDETRRERDRQRSITNQRIMVSTLLWFLPMATLTIWAERRVTPSWTRI